MNTLFVAMLSSRELLFSGIFRKHFPGHLSETLFVAALFAAISPTFSGMNSWMSFLPELF